MLTKVAWVECDAGGCDARYDLVGDQLQAVITMIDVGWTVQEQDRELRVKHYCPQHGKRHPAGD